MVEQDHRGIKRIVKPMMGFNAFHSAEVTLAGVELYRMIKKGQHVNAKNSTAFEQFYALAAPVGRLVQDICNHFNNLRQNKF